MRTALLVAAAALSAVSSPTFATWSIVLVDTRTGEVAVASATCLTNFDLRANTPVLIPGIGAAAAQSAVDQVGTNRVFIRDRLAQGVAPDQIIAQLAAFDPGHQSRQYGIVDSLGRAATFSGTGDGAWAGGQTGRFTNIYAGQIGSVAYSIQGNVLTGPPVVDQAVLAAIGTPGDLPVKLMAAMQAARLMGGDGRCSCSASAPTSCGSPPPSFVKSSHIAYMLIARAGDREGSDGLYRLGSQPARIIAADLTGDGLPELLLANTTSNTVSVLTNLTGSLIHPAPFPAFSPTPATYNTGTTPRALAVADVTGDGVKDLITADTGISAISVHPGIAGGTFGPSTTYPAGFFPRAIAVGDFDGVNGLDLAIASANSNAATVLLNNGSGAFPNAVMAPTDAAPSDIVAVDIVGSPALDLVVACQNGHSINILRGTGDGTFVLDQVLAVNPTPIAVAARDFDGDGRIDLAVACDSSQNIQVFHNAGSGFTSVSIPLGFVPVDMAAGAVGNGSRPDLIVAGSTRLVRLANNGSGVFALDRSYTFSGTVAGMVLSDLDGDGDLDAAFANNGLSCAMTVRNDGPGALAGGFNDGIGCATGDYFMNFNIAFQTTTDPDPVLQLQGRFDPWRAQLIGRPDAVQSLVSINPPQLPSTGAAAIMTITLRDWQGAAITAPIASVTVSVAPGSPALTTVAQAVSQGGGVYIVPLAGGSTAGIEHFVVRVDDGIRPVVLMPNPAISVYAGACYANCDGSTGAPPLTAADFMCFMDRFAAGDPYANCDASTVPPALNVGDFICFLNRFAAGCP